MSNWKNVNLKTKYLYGETQKSFKVVIPTKGHFYIPKSQCRFRNGFMNIGINQDWDTYTFTTTVENNNGEVDYIPTPEMNGEEFYNELKRFEE